MEVIIIYKELIKNYVKKITLEDIKKFALSKNEILTDQETLIIYNYIKKHYLELLNNDTKSFTFLKQNLRSDLFNKIIKLYSEYNKYI